VHNPPKDIERLNIRPLYLFGKHITFPEP